MSPDDLLPPPALGADPKATWNPDRAGLAEDLTVFQAEAFASLTPLEEWDLESGRQTGPRLPGAYKLRQKIGQGGQGEVWEAHQVSLQRVMALKRLRREWLLDPHATPERVQGLMEAFRREALTMALLDHPGVLPIFDFWEDDEGHPILSMKRVQGLRWDQELAADYAALPYPDHLARHLAILVHVAQTVAFAHSKGILHRDLKPAQVMLGAFGEVWLLDWGLAVGVQEGVRGPTPLAEAPNPAGSPAYMAPEQTRASPLQLGPSTDVYLLGGLLYEILTGVPPHGLGSSSDAFLRAAKGLVDPLAEHRPARDWPEDLEHLALEALAADPTHRPPSAQAFLERLQAHLTGRSRRQQAEVWVQQARAMKTETCTSYGPLSQALAVLHRAMEAWPDHPEAARFRNRLLTRQTELALAQGDLGLAEASAFRITDDTTRERLCALVEAQRAVQVRQHRSRRWALAACGVLAFATLGLGTKSYLDQRATARVLQAQHQRAEGLTLYMMDDLRRSLEPVGRLDLLKDVAQRVLAYYEALPAKERSTEARLQQAKALRQVADVMTNQNDTTQAAKALAAAEAILRSLPPSLEGLGDEQGLALWAKGSLAIFEGRMPDALRDLEQAAGLLRAALARHPTPRRQQDLEALLLALGDLNRRQGHPEPARAALAEAEALLVQLQAQGQSSLQVQRQGYEVSVSRAELAFDAGAYDAAESAFREAVAKMEATLARHEDFLLGRGLLAEVHQRLGDLYSLTSRKDRGMAEYEVALTWARAACTLDPGRSTHKDHLGLLLNRVAQLYINDHRPARGTPYLTESRALYLRLAEANPESPDWVSRLAYVEGLLGWGERELKHYAISLQYFDSALARVAGLCAKQPGHAQLQMEWAIQLIENGLAHKLVGRKAEATARLEQALGLLQAQRAKAPHPVQAELMAEAYVHLERPDAARPLMEECLKAGYMVEEVRALAKKAHIALP